jgi:hypothetical protein
VILGQPGDPGVEVLGEAVEHPYFRSVFGFFSVSTWSQIAGDRDMKRRILALFASLFESKN